MIRLTRPPCPNPQALAARNYKHPTNKAALETSTNRKCMYCESHIKHIDFGDVEHIKPKAPNKYPELEFAWDNLGYACGVCNGSKADKYDKDLPCVDPYSENPSDYLIAYGPFLWRNAGSERGEWVIRELALNRTYLVTQRAERLTAIEAAFTAACRSTNANLRAAAIAELDREATPDKAFSLTVQAFLERLRSTS